MSYTPSDPEVVWDIVHAALEIRAYLEGIDRPRFDSERMRQDAVIRQLEIMGEASTRLSREFRETHAGLPWSDIIAMRNVLIHAYHRVNLDRVWRVATEDVPELLAELEPLPPPEPLQDDAGGSAR